MYVSSWSVRSGMVTLPVRNRKTHMRAVPNTGVSSQAQARTSSVIPMALPFEYQTNARSAPCI